MSPVNSPGATASCQKAMFQCGLLQQLCTILMATGVPADILTEVRLISESYSHGPCWLVHTKGLRSAPYSTQLSTQAIQCVTLFLSKVWVDEENYVTQTVRETNHVKCIRNTFMWKALRTAVSELPFTVFISLLSYC